MLKQIIKKIFHVLGYDVRVSPITNRPRRENELTAQHFFDLFFSLVNAKETFVVQIGAHDGSFVDPLHAYIKKYQLRGVLVEPQRDVYARLKETYRTEPNIVCANVAISEQSGTRTLYTIKESFKKGAFSTRGTGIASFNKENFLKNLTHELAKQTGNSELVIPKHIDDVWEEISVDTLSFADFVERYGIKRIDVLQIDCEGYDYEILKMFDFERFSPRLINYEIAYLSESDRVASERLLASKGYTTFRHRYDTCAFK